MYDYETQRPQLFTESGQELLQKLRANVDYYIKLAGAVRAQESWENVGGDTWTLLAALDYMVERGEIHEVTNDREVYAQHRVFTR